MSGTACWPAKSCLALLSGERLHCFQLLFTNSQIKMTETQNIPDYVLDPNAVLHDTDAAWRYGKPPDYTKTRDYYERSKYPSCPIPFFDH